MPVVRKKTSNRGTTKKRASIQDKGRESRKKQKRAAKTNVQWKSNIKKDPGIPSNYPYKDQILAEVAEERRQVAEEKQKRKDEKKASKTGGATDNASDAREAAEEPIVFDGVGGISGKATAREKGKGKVVDADVEMEDAEAVPVLINRDLASLQSVLDAADVIIQVLDARDPLAFRSIHLDEISAKTGKKTLLILNKIDTVPRESVASWLAYLRTQHPTLPFRASTACLPLSPEALANASKPRAKPSATDAPTADSILAQLSAWAQEKSGDEPLAVAVVGLTNAGKSAFINSLLGEVALPVYQLSSSSLAPTTTSLPQEVTLEASGSKIRVIDTPGLSWVAAEDQTLEERDIFRARDILLRNKGRIDRLKDPHSALEHIVSRADTEGLMLLYNLAAFPKGDASAFLAGVARSNGMVKKAGVLDLAGAARNVLRDWSVGRFPRFTPAPTASTSAEQDVRDEAVLAQLKTRKEMRKEGGLVKFIASPVESRRANVEGEWPGLKEEENSEDENEEGGSEEEEDVEMDDAEAEDSDEEEEEDVDEPMEEPVEEPVPIVSGKQKRAGKKLAPTRPAKKVAFAADPKESKQARSAAGAAGKKAAPPAKTPAKAAVPPAKTPAALTAAAKPANVPSGKKTTATRGGEEAYDFGKFF